MGTQQHAGGGSALALGKEHDIAWLRERWRHAAARAAGARSVAARPRLAVREVPDEVADRETDEQAAAAAEAERRARAARAQTRRPTKAQRDCSPWAPTFACGADFPERQPKSSATKRPPKVWAGVSRLAVARELADTLARVAQADGLDAFVAREGSRARTLGYVAEGGPDYARYRLRLLVWFGRQTGALTRTRELRRLLGDLGVRYTFPLPPVATAKEGAAKSNYPPRKQSVEEFIESWGTIRVLPSEPRSARRRDRELSEWKKKLRSLSLELPKETPEDKAWWDEFIRTGVEPLPPIKLALAESKSAFFPAERSLS